jgi:hypothetical protein
VDAGYLQRDPAGAAYRVHLPGKGEVRFRPDVTGVDALTVVLTPASAPPFVQARSAASSDAG